MAWDRVIQDSDDEDDPLCETTTSMDPPPKNLRGQDASTRIHKDLAQDTSIDTSTANHDINGESARINLNTVTEDVVDNDSRVSGSQLGVDFDDFLQSPEGGQARLTSSQQRREEKWLPGNSSGISRLGSIGAVMTEIDLAQRRLLDDETSYTNHGQQLYPDSVQGEQLQYVTPFTYKHGLSQDVTHQSNDAFEPGLGQLASNQDSHFQRFTEQEDGMSEHGLIHRSADDDRNVNGHCYDDNETVQIPSHESGPSTAGYNFFESSLEKRSADHSNAENDVSFTRPSGNDQNNELHRTPFRSKSLQTTSYSPHDTEPMSSLVSPTINRAKSDNATSLALQQEQDQPLSQRSIHNELSIPVSIEIPIVKKTKGRMEKQDVVIDEEDDELALPDAHEVSHETKEQMKPDDAAVADDNEAPYAVAPENDMPQEMNINVPGEAPAEPSKVSPPAIPEVHFAKPAKPETKTREPKKKKLKRGKTTSITLKKTYEPDVEDDVIWIDEGRSYSGTQNRWIPGNDSFLPKSSKPVTDSSGSQVESNPSEPKKRGRKRKKTSEQQQVQTSTSVADSSSLPAQYGQEELDSHTQFEKMGPPSHNVHHQDEDTSDNIHKINDDFNHDQDQGGGQITYTAEPKTEKCPDKTATQQEQSYPSTNLTEPLNQQPPSVTQSTKQTTADNPLTPNGKQRHQHQQQEHANEPPYQPEYVSGTDTADSNGETALNTGKGVLGKDPRKGPDKHSPIAATSRTPYRVGLSRRAKIAPLLKFVKR